MKKLILTLVLLVLVLAACTATTPTPDHRSTFYGGMSVACTTQNTVDNCADEILDANRLDYFGQFEAATPQKGEADYFYGGMAAYFTAYVKFTDAQTTDLLNQAKAVKYFEKYKQSGIQFILPTATP